jgi:hypothetical protein
MGQIGPSRHTVVTKGAKVRFVNNDPWDHHVRGAPTSSVFANTPEAYAAGRNAGGFELRMQGKDDGKPAKFQDVTMDQTGPQVAVALGCFFIRLHARQRVCEWFALGSQDECRRHRHFRACARWCCASARLAYRSVGGFAFAGCYRDAGAFAGEIAIAGCAAASSDLIVLLRFLDCLKPTENQLNQTKTIAEQTGHSKARPADSSCEMD